MNNEMVLLGMKKKPLGNFKLKRMHSDFVCPIIFMNMNVYVKYVSMLIFKFLFFTVVNYSYEHNT